MRSLFFCALMASVLLLQGCVPVRGEATYWTVSGGGTLGTPPYQYDGGGCTSDHRPRYMNLQFAKGVIVSYGYGYGLNGHIFVPPGVTARFVDGVATVRGDSGTDTQGKIVGLKRRLYGAPSEELMQSAPLIGWTREELAQHVQYYRSESPKGNGSAQALTWNHFEFSISFKVDRDDAFTLILPTLEIDGQAVPSSELRFTKKTSVEWTMQPCV